MLLTLLKCKLHKVTVTHSELEYEGSCAIDAHLLEASGIRPYEQIHIYNLANGERFVTYAIRAEAGSGVISVNGAAAHKASPGDRVIICAYTQMDAAQAERFKPTLCYFDGRNQIVRMGEEIPEQAA
ncbi:aspartate 1-decarboxylase [Thiorhodospira sibirica]|uniref:aspartate 1-decarboxylase n=1 Tax=Thiorhodospira sibirica TaxID=154347 RepID=UPI00022C170B|nr:aspartate 1-decarboxylase [Thiorhodospira sibirica]